jgi:hypothetical protein
MNYNTNKNNKMFVSPINKVNGVQSRNTNLYSAPVDFNVGNGVMGSYDNILFQTQCARYGEGWKAPICVENPTSNRIFLPQGTPLPLKNEEIYSELPKDSMFIFAKNRASPLCNSQYSTDRGQICSTPAQTKYIGEMRGYNQTYNNYNF